MASTWRWWWWWPQFDACMKILLILTVIGIIWSPGTTAVGTLDLVTFSPKQQNWLAILVFVWRSSVWWSHSCFSFRGFFISGKFWNHFLYFLLVALLASETQEVEHELTQNIEQSVRLVFWLIKIVCNVIGTEKRFTSLRKTCSSYLYFHCVEIFYVIHVKGSERRLMLITICWHTLYVSFNI